MSPETRKAWDAWQEYMATVPCTRPDCPMCDGYHYVNRMDVAIIDRLSNELKAALDADPDMLAAAREIKIGLVEKP